MRKHFLLLFIWILLPFINSSAEGNRANNSLLDEDNLSYCVPEGNVNRRGSPTERRLQTITISGATLNNEAAPFSNTLNNTPQPNVYLDATDAIITTSQGDELTVSWTFRNDISWMHYYIYIDYDQDGVFNEEDELVSFTYFNASSEDDAPNSIGEMVSAGASFTTAPKFTIPQDVLTGKTRLRFKVDWNSKNPCGHPGPQNIIGANNGTIVDYIIDIHPASAVATSTITLPESVENGSLTVKAGEREIANGETVENGTELTFTAIPDPGYVLDYLKINDVLFTESTYTVTGDAVITVAFVKEPVSIENKAITIPQTDYAQKTGYRLEVAETILGDRSNTETGRTGKSFTLSAWVNIDKITSDSKNKGAVIMGHGPQVHMNYNGSLVLGITETGELKVISGASNKIDQPLSTHISLDAWTYLTLVYDNDTYKIKVYKDGVLAGEEIQLSKELELFGDDPCIFFVGGMGFSGLCDELQFFNKALSVDEVEQAYKNPVDMPNLTAWYDFNKIVGENDGSFLNKATVADKASEKAVFYKYTGNVTSDPGLISGGVAQAIPTLVNGRIPVIAKYTITLPTEVTNGTLTVMNGETALVAGENEVEEGAVLTITATPALGYILDYLKINDAPITESTYTVTGDAVITVAFVEEAVEAASKAIHVPANNGDIKYQFRFDDIVLGEHVNGTNNKWDNGIINRGDNRARNFTMSVWIRPLNKNGELFGHAQAPFYGAQGTFGVGIDGNNKLVLKARAWLDEGSCNGITNLTSEETLQLNEWAFLTVAVDDDARTIKLYKNGTLLVTGDLSVTSDGTEAHGIGLLQDECVFFAGNGSASCDVDEVQVWNKTLSAEEIATSMESFTEAPENLIAFYKFDENSIENIPNQGTGVECTAGLVSGTSKYQGAPYWAEVYTCTPTQATLVDGHILPKLIVNYVSETDHGSFVIKDGDNTIASGSKVSQGTTLTIDATPAEGYQVKSIKVNDVEIVGNTFVLEEESTITVEFAEAYIVKYTASENGTLEVKENNVIIENNTAVVSGTVLTIIAKPADNAVLSAFTINGVDKLSEINETMEMSVTVSEALDIQAEFSPLWKVTCNITGEGSVKIEDEDGNVYESGVSSIPDGSMITLTFTPEAGYELTDFTLDGASYIQHVADGKFVFEMDADYTFNVAFSQITSLHNTSADAVTVRYTEGALQITGMNAGDRLDIYDVAGNYVRTSEEANTNVSDLANGCYLVKVTAGNTVKTVKFIKR